MCFFFKDSKRVLYIVQDVFCALYKGCFVCCTRCVLYSVQNVFFQEYKMDLVQNGFSTPWPSLRCHVYSAPSPESCL